MVMKKVFTIPGSLWSYLLAMTLTMTIQSAYAEYVNNTTLNGISASTKYSPKSVVYPHAKLKTKIANMPQSQRSFQAVAPLQNLEKRSYTPNSLPNKSASAPKDVACEPDELVLFAGLSYSGCSYDENLAVMGAYAPTTFRNLTMDTATGYNWSVKETYKDKDKTTITGDSRDFTVNTKGGAVYEDFSLIVSNEDAASNPYNWGIGHAANNDETGPRYDVIHAYAGKGARDFKFADGTYAVMTRQNPDYDLTYYVNWGTPNYADSYNISRISTIYSYQGKPATPLFLTGVTLPLVAFEAQEDFNLHIKLCKCQRSATGNLTLGDVIAESDATMDNVNADYDAGMTAVEFTKLYIKDESGMSKSVDYLFIEDEFVIVIEGWDNGTFSGVLGSQDLNFNENTSTWFQEIGSDMMKSYSGGWPQLFIGLLDATYGYLHTNDNTNLTFSKEGGTSTIHIDPMYNRIDEKTGKPTYNLFVNSIYENGNIVNGIPEWISIDITNEDYTTVTSFDEGGNEYEYYVNGIDYDMVITVDALPFGSEGRTCQIVFFQPGAKLSVTIIQDVSSAAIKFADASVKAICVSNWDINGDYELSETEAVAVTSLNKAFRGNTSIKSFNELQYFTGLSSIDNYAFYGCSGLTSVTIPNSVSNIGNFAFYGCSALTSVVIPNSVSSIGDTSFKDCINLKSINIPNSITNIGCSAFDGCSGLTSVTIPNNVTSISDAVFSDCSSLTSVTIPNGVTSIGKAAFLGCGALTSVTIPSSVTSIGNSAFYVASVTDPIDMTYCHSLTSVISYIQEPFTCKAFDTDTYNKAILYVPEGTAEKYQNTDDWKNFKNIKLIQNGNENEKRKTNLVLWGKSGSVVAFALSKKPKITFTETDMQIIGEDIDVTYPLDDLARFTYETEDDATAIKDINTEKEILYKFTGDSLLFPALKANSTVSIYSLNGTLVYKKAIQTAGEYSFPLSSLNAGVYLVSVNGLTYKIVKK